MKTKHHQYTIKGTENKTAWKSDRLHLENLANELDRMARHKLRDGCLDGCLRGHEAEIRQDAIQLALQWHARGQTGQGSEITHPASWNSAKAIANALRFVKLRHARSLSSAARHESVEISENLLCCMHPRTLPIPNLPTSVRQAMVRQGIKLALQRDLITHGNACVSQLVLVEGVAVSAVALLYGYHRSAIYQHIRRTTKAVQTLIHEVEVPSQQ